MPKGKRFKAKEVLADPGQFKRIVKRGQLGSLIAMLRSLSKTEPIVVNGSEQIDVLLEAVAKYHLDNPMFVDHREFWVMVDYAKEVGFEVAHLDTGSGDYKSKRVSFERKEDDLSPSVYDRRLSRQLTAMREEAEFSFLIVTKSWSDVKEDMAKRGLNEQVLIGIVASCCAAGYPPLFIDDPFNATQLMHKISNKIDDDKHRLYVPRPQSPDADEYALALIEALPSVSKVRAKTLLKRFGSVQAVANASIDDLCEIEGIGLATDTKIHAVFNIRTK